MTGKRPASGAPLLDNPVILGAVAVVLSGLAGFVAPLPVDTSAPSRALNPPPAFVHPGAVLAEAARRMHGPTGSSADEVALAGTELDTSIDVTPPARKADIAEVFRRELSAVVTESNGQTVVIVSDGGALKKIAVGSAYRDGWRVKAIEPGAVMLAARSDVRRVAIMGDYPAPVFTAAGSGEGFAPPPRRLVLSRQDARGGAQ